MKFLFLVGHGLHLRNYESLIRGLANAGHQVVIEVTTDKSVDNTLLNLLPAECRKVSVVSSPMRTGWWWPANDPLRATRDYLRYLDPVYASAPTLVARGARPIPAPIRALFERFGLGRSAGMLRLVDRLLQLVERSINPDPQLVKWYENHKPDAVLITPLVDFNYHQLDALKAAQSLGIPTGLLVASWDNLTNKGLIQIEPDQVVVWNEFQRHEAEAMHRIRPERIKVTGAQLFDQWFDMVPSEDRDAFCARLGLRDLARPIILYLCSSSFICPNEVGFVSRWLTELRSCADPDVRSANVIVRPHPMHAEQWAGQCLTDNEHAVVWPPGGAAPLDTQRKQDYFDSLYHAEIVVGINTSGFLEAAILGRPTLTLRAREFPGSQEGTLHFHYLVEGGVLHVTDDIAEHLGEIGNAFRGLNETNVRVRRFVEQFLRPNGIERPCTPILVELIERLAADGGGRPAVASLLAPFVRSAMVPVAMLLRPRYLSRLALRRQRRMTPSVRIASEDTGHCDKTTHKT